MNLHSGLLARVEAGRPVRIALIGAGKFASMFLAQLRRTPGFHLLALADLDPERARQALATTGWDVGSCLAPSPARAHETGGTWITDDGMAAIAAAGVEVVIDATGSPAAGIAHALAAIDQGRHLVMVNVEADCLAGPLLAERARAAGLVYSMAYGDQPALISEMVDWARAAGFAVTAAGKGTKYLPAYHASTPDTVWEHYGFTAEQIAKGGFNPRMFNSFLDGTKSGIEMAAVANACGLAVPEAGLAFPPAGTHELAQICKPHEAGGALERTGQVEVVSSLQRDGSQVTNDLRWGVYVTFEAGDGYVERCFAEYGLVTDATGHYAAMWKPFHLIGLELGISVASAAVRGEPTGSPRGFAGDVVAVAKRPLKAGETLDGEGGFTVWGKLQTAAASLAAGALPLGLAHGVSLKRDLDAGATLAWADVEIDETAQAVKIRREMEHRFEKQLAV